MSPLFLKNFIAFYCFVLTKQKKIGIILNIIDCGNARASDSKETGAKTKKAASGSNTCDLKKGFSDGLQSTNPDSHSDILDFSVKVKDGNRLAGKPASSR